MSRLPSLAMGLLLAATAATAGAAKPDPLAEAAKVPRYVLLRVQVDATGHVTDARALDKQTLPALAVAGNEIARKLEFTPARKDGVAVPSETSLMLALVLVPKPDGSAGIALQRAYNGPNVLRVGRAPTPKVSRGDSGVIYVGADLRADGSVNMDTFKVDKAEVHVSSSAAEERFVAAARISLKDTVFQLDKVGGVEIPAHISVPYQFNGGGGRRGRPGGDDEDEGGNDGDKAGGGEHAPEHQAPPKISAVSSVAGVELAKVDYEK